MKQGEYPRDIEQSSLSLTDNSRVAVIEGGHAGSFFSYFLLALAERVGLDLHLDIFESRDFFQAGPSGCNMCGGIVSESLIQTLATEGIDLPPTVIQRGINSYLLHMDVGSVKIETPLNEKRIGAVHRGAGPKGSKHPFGDRLVFIGDCGISRLYKDGIGAAYKTAKAAATTAVLHGISSGGAMKTNELGKLFSDGQIIIRQGEAGDVMFEILSGRVEVLQEREGNEFRLAVLEKGDFFGEMAIFEREVRSATVRTLGEVRVLTIDKKILLRRISENPSLALRILEKMSRRIQDLDSELVRLRTRIP